MGAEVYQLTLTNTAVVLIPLVVHCTTLYELQDFDAERQPGGGVRREELREEV